MLKRDEIKQYWADRASKQGARTVGFGGAPMDVQDERYRHRKAFIFGSGLVCRYQSTLDYGCGIGRYSDDFTGEYIGADITEALLMEAVRDHPERAYVQLGDVNTSDYWFMDGIEQVFTATVLQHCHEDVCRDLFKAIHEARPEGGFAFVMYEKGRPANECRHVAGRHSAEYVGMISEHWHTVIPSAASHTIHGEVHNITRVEV